MIFLDYASATPVLPSVLDAMLPYFSEQFFNPSAPYLPAKSVQTAYRTAKDEIAHAIGAKGNDLIITSGATEATNLAFTAIDPALIPSSVASDSVCLISATEHDSVFSAASRYPFAEIAVDRFGQIDLIDLEHKISPATQLISIALANNETGTIQSLSNISALVRRLSLARLQSGNRTPLLLHADASQGLGLLDISVSRLGVNLLTLSAAKVYGPKAVGALYVGRGLKLRPQILGGGQERGLRSGTENVAGVVGFAAAATQAKERLGSHRRHYQSLRSAFLEHLRPRLINPVLIGSSKSQLLNFCPVSFPGIDAERLIFALEDREIYVSTGAACAASKGQRSRALSALGLSATEIAGSIRITFGLPNTQSDVITAAKTISELVDVEAERIGL